MAEKKKLRNTNGSFELVGNINLGLDRFKSDTSASGYAWSRLSTTVDCNGSRPFITAMGGYMQGSPYPLNFWDNGNEFSIDWHDRFNEKLVEKVPNYSKITIALQKDEDDKLIYEDFLSWYDALEHIETLVKDEQIEDSLTVKVRGKIKYKEYDGKNQYELEVNKIFLTDAEESDFHATFKQNMLVDADSLNKDRYKEDKEIDINAYIIGYDSDEKVNRAFRHDFVVREEDFKNTDQFKKMLAMLSVSAKKKEKIVEIEVTGNIVRSTNRRKATEDDFDSGVLDFFGDSMDELLDTDIIDNDNEGSGNALIITLPSLRKDKESGKRKMHRVTNNDKDFPYKEKDLVFVSSKQDVENIDDVIEMDELDSIELDDLELDLD